MTPPAKDMEENLYRALWSFLICVAVTVIVSLFTRPKTAEELKGLVRGLTDMPSESGMAIYQRPLFWGIVLGVLFAILQWIFW
jgi:SSS family solute:Na+ symporter